MIATTKLHKSSDETIDVPRSFSPPGYAIQVPTTARTHLRSSSLAKADSSRKIPLYLDGHTYSADNIERRYRCEPSGLEIPLRHYCATCGRARSKRFHHENPLRNGVIPVPGICSRCEPSRSPSQVPIARKRSDQKEVEEVLIRRGRQHSNPIIRIFQPCPVEVVRVTHRRRNSRGRSNSDEERIAPPLKRENSIPRRRISIRARDVEVRPARDRWSSSDDQPVRRKIHLSASTNYRRNADELIASHPNPWSHGRMVTINPSPRRYSSDNGRATAPSQPEWYYRHYRSYVVPRTSSPETKVRRREVGKDFGDIKEPRPRSPPATVWPERRRPSPIRRPIKGILNRPGGDDRNTGYVERDRYPRRNRYSSDSSESDRRDARVKFVDAMKERKTRSRNSEAAKDRIEEKLDHYDYNNMKKSVRKDVQHGAGDFELDGHYSDELDNENESSRVQDDGSETSPSNLSEMAVDQRTEDSKLSAKGTVLNDETSVPCSENSTSVSKRNDESDVEVMFENDHDRDQESYTSEDLSMVFDTATVDSGAELVSDAWQAEAKVEEYVFSPPSEK